MWSFRAGAGGQCYVIDLSDFETSYALQVYDAGGIPRRMPIRAWCKARILYGVSSPGPGSDIVGDVVEWFPTRAEAERFIAEVASEPSPDDTVIADALSVVELELECKPQLGGR